MHQPPPKHVSRTYSHRHQRAIYCFAYGPIVNPTVRKRRRLATVGEPQPACLPEFRLSFEHGGFVNLVRQRGYEVHGVLLKFDSEEEWEYCRRYDEGYNKVEKVEVFPYEHQYGNVPGDYRHDQQQHGDSVVAYTMVTRDYDDLKINSRYEQLPSERYLKLIASGLREHGVDRDYIEDQVMNIPFEPTRNPSEYQRIPESTSSRSKGITFRRYRKLCRNSRQRTTCFAFGNSVVRLGPHDPKHPSAVWVRQRLHGKPDAALIVHQAFWEPELPTVEASEDLSAKHLAWCENFLVEFLAAAGISLTKVYHIVPEQRRRAHALPQISFRLPPLFRCFKGLGPCLSSSSSSSFSSLKQQKESGLHAITPLTDSVDAFRRPYGYPCPGFPEDQSSRSLSSMLFRLEGFHDDANDDAETVNESSWFMSNNDSFRPMVRRVTSSTSSYY